MTPVAVFGPALARVMLKVIVSPTLGVALLTDFVTARSACCGVSVALAVVGRVRIELVGGGDGRRVGLGGGTDHGGGEGQCRRGIVGERAHGPLAQELVVTALTGRRRHEIQPGRQQVIDRHAGGCIGAIVGQSDREGDRVADVGRRVAHRLVQGQVGLLRRLGGAGRVVGRVGVELVRGGNHRRVGLRLRGCPPGLRASASPRLRSPPCRPSTPRSCCRRSLCRVRNATRRSARRQQVGHARRRWRWSGRRC